MLQLLDLLFKQNIRSLDGKGESEKVERAEYVLVRLKGKRSDDLALDAGGCVVVQLMPSKHPRWPLYRVFEGSGFRIVERKDGRVHIFVNDLAKFRTIVAKYEK